MKPWYDNYCFSKSALQTQSKVFNCDMVLYYLRNYAEKGEIISTLETTFPAESLTNPNMFVSLLFYYGMLTIKGVRGGLLTLGIPNNNVRKQYYDYLLEQYEEKATLITVQL